jgi:hypothetical protein
MIIIIKQLVMAISDINEKLITVSSKGKNGYTTLLDSVKTNKTNLKKITRRDALYLINKQMEGVSETRGNLFIYMFYFAGINRSKKWYSGITPNDGNTDSTPWCACYTSFCLNISGITEKGTASAKFSQASVGLSEKITDFSQVKTMDLVSINSHVAFAVKENPNKPNNYKEQLHFFGGNQSNKVGIGPQSWYANPVGFARNSDYNTEISSGDFLSVLSYFKEANKKTGEQRKKEINSRIDKSVKVNDTLEKEVREARKLIGETDSTFGGGYYINDTKIRERFKELLTFEQSLLDSNLPLTQNITASKNNANTTSTR